MIEFIHFYSIDKQLDFCEVQAIINNTELNISAMKQFINLERFELCQENNMKCLDIKLEKIHSAWMVNVNL